MLESRSDSIDRRGLQCILGTRVGGHDVGHLVDTVFTHLAEYRKEGAPTQPYKRFLFPSYLSPRCYVERSPISGRGVFARTDIDRHAILSVWGGHLINTAQLDRLSQHMQTFPVQVDDDLFLGPTCEAEIEPVDMTNHSCQPSGGVVQSIVLVALRHLRPGDEITFDYSTTDTRTEPFKCTCGSPRCRGIVTPEHDWQDEDFRFLYKGFLSLYIEDKVRNRSS